MKRLQTHESDYKHCIESNDTWYTQSEQAQTRLDGADGEAGGG